MRVGMIAPSIAVPADEQVGGRFAGGGVYIEKFDVRVHRLADAQDAVAGRVDTDIFN